jgi:hypothetical protein
MRTVIVTLHPVGEAKQGLVAFKSLDERDPTCKIVISFRQDDMIQALQDAGLEYGELTQKIAQAREFPYPEQPPYLPIVLTGVIAKIFGEAMERMHQVHGGCRRELYRKVPPGPEVKCFFTPQNKTEPYGLAILWDEGDQLHLFYSKNQARSVLLRYKHWLPTEYITATNRSIASSQLPEKSNRPPHHLTYGPASLLSGAVGFIHSPSVINLHMWRLGNPYDR